MLAKMLQ